METPWTPATWRDRPAAQQPSWPDAGAYDAVLKQLSTLPPLVFAGEARELTTALGQVADWQKPYFEVVNEALAVTKARPNVTYWGQVETVLSNAFNDIVTSGQDVKDTLEKYQQEIDKAASGG